MTFLLDWLVKNYPLAKRQTLKRMVQAGRVRVNGNPASRLSQPLTRDDKVVVLGQPKSDRRHQPQWLEYEDEDILVVNKPAGLLTSTVPREPRPTLLALVREHVSKSDPRARPGLIHRLDRDASGLLVFSKNAAAYRSLKSQFFHHSVVREYRAIVHGVPDPPAGRIESRLVERTDGTVHSTRQHGKGEIAITRYETLRTDKKLSLLRVILETGRKHQIRVHLREHGNPIMGDNLYSPDETVPRLMLCATRITLRHPRTRREMTFEIRPPGEFPLTEI